MSGNPPDWHELIGAIYDAALDDALWTPAIGQVMEQVGASQSILFSPIVDAQASRPLILNRHIPDDYWELYKAHYWQCDVWTPLVMEAERQGHRGVVHGDRLMHRAKFRRTEYFQDYLRPLGIEAMLGATVLDGLASHSPPRTQLGLFRAPGAESFGEREERLFGDLLPHLQRALAIRWRMAECHETRLLQEAALDRMAQAVALLDERGRLLFANRRAEAIFRAGEGFTVVNGRVAVAGVHDSGSLREALRRAVSGVGSTLRLQPPGQPAWVATFSPLRVPGSATGARILMLMASPGRPAADGLPAFAALYRLTPAETRVLAHLLEQASTQDIAAALHISIKTLRIHLSNLFAKTGTANQRELLRFYLGHPG